MGSNQIRFTNNVRFEFSWNITSKIKYKWLGRIVNMLRSEVSRTEVSHPRKRSLLALVKNLNERALTLLGKDFDAVVHNSEEETRNRLKGSRITGWGCYIFARKNAFYFTWKALFQFSWCYQMPKHKTRITFYEIPWEVNTVC